MKNVNFNTIRLLKQKVYIIMQVYKFFTNVYIRLIKIDKRAYRNYSQNKTFANSYILFEANLQNPVKLLPIFKFVISIHKI